MAVEHFRLLAAIMFADMVGFSALMQEDEENAVRKRDLQREILEECILQNQGRVIQYYGDGTLSIFASAIRSVECAVDVQKRLNEADINVPLRIGLHVGDIVYDDEGAYGDAVNLAARIQALSTPGSILISDRLHEELRNHPKIKTKYLGLHKLKNISRPVAIYAVSNKGLPMPTQTQIQAQTGSYNRTIAVLPFVNMSIDPENEYFSDGITEEIINALTRVEGIEITSRTSAFAFKGLSKDIRQIGQELSVRYVLEGSVRKAANRVRITAQLIDTEDGFHIWSEVFDRDLEDIFKVQDEISRKIAAKLKEDFSDADLGISTLVEPSTENVRAYHQFLKGNYYLHKWTPETTWKAINQFEKAVDLCPEYAEAYAGIANCYSYLGATGRLSAKNAYPKAEKAALKSIELNDRLPDSHIALAFVHLFYHWNFKEAKKSLRRAKAISSDSPIVCQANALYLRMVDKPQAAIRELKEALRKDPLSLTINADLGRAYLNAGRAEEAVKQFRKTRELDENFRSAIEGEGWGLVALGKYDKALEAFTQYYQKVGHALRGLTPLAYLHGLMGNRKQALQYLDMMKQREKSEPELSLFMDCAVIYLGLKEYEKMFDCLHKAIDEKLGGILFINSYPIWEPIRHDQRFVELLNRIGIQKKSRKPIA